MYPYFFRYKIKTGFDVLNEQETILRGDDLLQLKVYFDEMIRGMLKEDYEAPSQRQLSNHGSRYENVFIDNVKYKVNITQIDPIGKIIYMMYIFTDSLQKAFDNGEQIRIFNSNQIQ
jgi:hypothetical protein